MRFNTKSSYLNIWIMWQRFIPKPPYLTSSISSWPSWSVLILPALPPFRLYDVNQCVCSALDGLAQDWHMVVHSVPGAGLSWWLGLSIGISQTWEGGPAGTTWGPNNMPVEGNKEWYNNERQLNNKQRGEDVLQGSPFLGGFGKQVNPPGPKETT